MSLYKREAKPVSVITFTTEQNEYGEIRKQILDTREVDMMIKLYQHTEVQMPVFNDVEVVGLTADKDINTNNQIVDGEMKYNVLYVIPSGRLTQVLMKKV